MWKDEAHFHKSLTLVGLEVNCQLNAPAVFPPGKEHPMPTEQECGRATDILEKTEISYLYRKSKHVSSVVQSLV
jgi:hypothetical protein